MLALQTLLLSTALLLALLLNLALKPSFSAKLNTAALSLAVLGGLVFYSVGFAEATGNLIISVVRTPYAVLRMFLGLNDLPTIEKTSLLSTNAGLVCFWVLHMLAFYSITSAVMTTLGAELLRTLRFFLSHRGDLTLIYGISPDRSVCPARKRSSLPCSRPPSSSTASAMSMSISPRTPTAV